MGHPILEKFIISELIGAALNVKQIPQLLKDPLYRGSLFIFLSSVTSSGLGFVFWIVATRFYSQAEVGFAVAVISAVSLVILISRLGMDQSIIRYFPEQDKGSILTTSLMVTTIVAMVLGVGFIVFAEVISSDFQIVRENPAVFFILVFVTSVTAIFGSAFVALRKSEYYFVQTLLSGIRIPLLIPFVVLGTVGILVSTSIATAVVMIAMVLLFARVGIKMKGFNSGFIRDSFQFSMVTYISMLLASSPTFIMPILVLNILGPESSAVYYITYSIAAIIFMIPSAMGISLFVEGSNGQPLLKNVTKAFAISMAVLVPVVTIIFFYSYQILELIGPEYAQEGAPLLVFITLSSPFMLVFQLFISVKTVQAKYRTLLFFSGLQFVQLMVLAFVFTDRYGMIGVGYAWLLSLIIMSVAILVVERKAVTELATSTIFASKSSE